MNIDAVCMRILIVIPPTICAKVTSFAPVHIIILNELFKTVKAVCRDWGFFKYFNHSLEIFSNGDTVDGFEIDLYVKGSSQRE